MREIPLFLLLPLYSPLLLLDKRLKQLDKPSEHYVVRRRTARRRLDRVRPTYDTERTANEKWERNKREKNERRRSGQQGKPLHFALLRFPPSPAPRFPQWRRPEREKEERLELGSVCAFSGRGWTLELSLFWIPWNLDQSILPTLSNPRNLIRYSQFCAIACLLGFCFWHRGWASVFYSLILVLPTYLLATYIPKGSRPYRSTHHTPPLLSWVPVCVRVRVCVVC